MISKATTALLAVLLGMSTVPGTAQNRTGDTQNRKAWAIAIHGGAGTISRDRPDSVIRAYRDDLEKALSIGRGILEKGGSALDAVEQTIRYLEDNPRFNAGKGAVFTHDAEHELDAAIMLGNTRNAGTVTGVKTVKNPISLARLVMENSRHVMFSAGGAEQFASEMGVERVDQAYFDTEHRYRALQRALREEETTEQETEKEQDGNRPQSLKVKQQPVPGRPVANLWQHQYGTVGCVAIDREGRIVAGTSTGGLTNKRYGRVGDVPIIGAGTYASEVVAVSMTGWGEKIMKAVSGHTVSSYMKFKHASLEEAGDYLLNEVLDPGDAGMIAVDNQGNIYMNMNTQGMFRGAADSEGRHEVAIWR